MIGGQLITIFYTKGIRSICAAGTRFKGLRIFLQIYTQVNSGTWGYTCLLGQASASSNHYKKKTEYYMETLVNFTWLYYTIILATVRRV